MVQLDELPAEAVAAAPARSNDEPYGQLHKLTTEELRAEVARLAALRAAADARARRGPLSDVDEEQAVAEERENDGVNAWCAAASRPVPSCRPASRARARAGPATACRRPGWRR